MRLSFPNATFIHFMGLIFPNATFISVLYLFTILHANERGVVILRPKQTAVGRPEACTTNQDQHALDYF